MGRLETCWRCDILKYLLLMIFCRIFKRQAALIQLDDLVTNIRRICVDTVAIYLREGQTFEPDLRN